MRNRFLNNNDYISIVTKEALQQLVRGNEERLAQAEEAAEASILEYLTDNYQVEKTLMEGKMILEYNDQITYPAGTHFYYEDKICMAMRAIKSRQSPTSVQYWQEMEYDALKFAEAVPYQQTGTWSPGDVVVFNETYFECLEYNGWDFNDIRIPGIKVWEELEVYDWQANVPYQKWDIVRYDKKYYAVINAEDMDLTVNPFDSDNWGLIGEYDKDYKYTLSPEEYVVFEDKVYYPVLQPIADELELGVNIKHHDPRNINLKKHILRLAVYELHKLISPNNISSARIADYEASIAWLRDANRCRINPGLPRKLDKENRPVTEFAIATFMRDYDPHKNPWQI